MLDMGRDREATHICPTRPDGVEPLLAHAVSAAMCAQRQDRRYHKCWSCMHHAGGAPIDAVPPVAEGEITLQPVPQQESEAAEHIAQIGRAHV